MGPGKHKSRVGNKKPKKSSGTSTKSLFKGVLTRVWRRLLPSEESYKPPSLTLTESTQVRIMILILMMMHNAVINIGWSHMMMLMMNMMIKMTESQFKEKYMCTDVLKKICLY